MNNSSTLRFCSEAGETLLSFLVSALISAILLSSALASYFDSSYRALDHQLISQTREQAKALLDIMVFDIRMLGAGMPLNQPNFQVGGAGLGTAPNPIFISSTASTINFRRNEEGVGTVLSADYTPAVGSLTFAVVDGSDFEVGDTVYISGASSGGTSGLQGVVTSAGSTTVSVASSYVASAAATFKAGSTVERVTQITYDSPVDWSGITRDAEIGTVLLSPRATFSLRYFDDDGVELVLPLTDAAIVNDLAAIEVTVNVRSKRALKSGNTYTAQVRQRVGLRNLYLAR